MNGKSIVAGLWLGLLMGVAGCARGEGKGLGEGSVAAGEAARASVHSFTFGGPGVSASSRVERSVRSGGELLKGTTAVAVAGSTLVLREEAEIDATGRLVLATAELRAGSARGALLRSIRLDAAGGSVSVAGSGEQHTWSVPVGEPLVYRDLVSDIAPGMADTTAVQAWVARLAARSSSRLRSLDVATRESHLTPVSQVLFTEERTVWVVLGDEAIETDDDFVRSLPWKSLEAAAERRAADLRCAPGPA